MGKHKNKFFILKRAFKRDESGLIANWKTKGTNTASIKTALRMFYQYIKKSGHEIRHKQQVANTQLIAKLT